MLVFVLNADFHAFIVPCRFRKRIYLLYHCVNLRIRRPMYASCRFSVFLLRGYTTGYTLLWDINNDEESPAWI